MEHSILLQTTPADCHEYFNVYLSRVMKVLSSITKIFSSSMFITDAFFIRYFMVISGLKVLARKCLHKLSEAFFVCFCQPATNNRLVMFVRRVGKHFSENRGLGGGKFAQNLEYTFYYSPIHLMKLNYMNQKGEGGGSGSLN